ENAGIFLWPFLAIHHAIAGWTGVFLFVRILYVAFLAFVGWSVFAFASKHIRVPAALLVGAACLCFIPYGLPGLSYNTVGAGFSAIALFTGAKALLEPPVEGPTHRDLFFWAGAGQGAAAFAYPTLLVQAVFAGVMVLALADRRFRALSRFVLG